VILGELKRGVRAIASQGLGLEYQLLFLVSCILLLTVPSGLIYFLFIGCQFLDFFKF
jgi:hypothetical protein